MECKYCNGNCIKRGLRKTIQKLYCKNCKKYFQSSYTNKMCTIADEEMIVKLNNEGVGISSIGRLLNISKANVVNKIKKIASAIIKPLYLEEQQEYEVDELHTIIGSKTNPYYIVYALNKTSKQIVEFNIGGRTKEVIGKVTESIKQLNPKKIFPDKLNVYPNLIGGKLHSSSPHKINHIERFNLTLRTHLKRLSRKTICFSKSKEMLENCLRIYFYKKRSYC